MTIALRNDRVFTDHTGVLTPAAFTDWRTDAACTGLPTDLFFPEGQGAAVDPGIRRLCEGCPVKADCLEHAVADPSLDGVWAGTTARQRMTIRTRTGRRGRNRGRDPQPCGTPAAYRRHQRNGEKPCEPCVTANSDRRTESRTA